MRDRLDLQMDLLNSKSDEISRATENFSNVRAAQEEIIEIQPTANKGHESVLEKLEDIKAVFEASENRRERLSPSEAFSHQRISEEAQKITDRLLIRERSETSYKEAKDFALSSTFASEAQHL